MSLFLSPASIARLELKNRVVMSPMCMFAVDKRDGVLTPFHFAHYGARAIGQVALIMIEATAVAPDGRITDKDLGLWNDEQEAALTDLVSMLHYLGAKVGIQLSHAGRKAEDAKDLVAPSAIPFSPQSRVPRALDAEGIAQIEDDFIASVERAKRAGVDMIELHGAHGYLMDQFLSPSTNQRNDEYGGSLKARYRFVQEITRRARERFDGSLWIRLSLTDYLPEGEQNSIDDWRQVGVWLEEDGIDCIDVSTGGIANVGPNIPVGPGYQVPYANALKSAITIPVATVGLLYEPGLCEHVLQVGHADLVIEGRVLLRDANWLAKAAVELHDKKFEVYSMPYWAGEPDTWKDHLSYKR